MSRSPTLGLSRSIPIFLIIPSNFLSILGPVIVNYMHDVRKEAGVPFDQIYAPIFYVLAGMLVVGFVANLLVRPVADKYFMTDTELAAEKKLAHEQAAPVKKGGSTVAIGGSAIAAVAWLAVLIPIGYGVWSTIEKAWALFS